MYQVIEAHFRHGIFSHYVPISGLYTTAKEAMAERDRLKGLYPEKSLSVQQVRR